MNDVRLMVYVRDALAEQLAASLDRLFVNPPAVEWCGVLPTDAEHEANVKTFLSSAQAEDPTRFAQVAEKYPTLSKTREKAIREREISAFSPINEANGGAGFDEPNAFFGGFGPYVALEDFISVNATVEAAVKAPPLRP
jgi:hypothetical protein